MGTLFSSPQKLASFSNDVFPSGLDLNRSDYHKVLGVWRAASAATFRAGQVVALSSTGEVQLSDGNDILGFAKWPKMSLGKSVKVDEAIVLPGTSVVSLKRGNVSNVAVRSAKDQGGTLYTAGGTDYTLSTANGTVQRAGGGTITDGATVYVTYTFDLVESDYEFQGKNFWNNLDWVTIQDSRIAVITDWATIYSSEYDTSRSYALTGTSSNVYVTSTGILSNNSGAGKFVGKVISLPSANDIYLGIVFMGATVAAT